MGVGSLNACCITEKHGTRKSSLWWSFWSCIVNQCVSPHEVNEASARAV